MAPYFIDWTNYRADFEREASRILGRSVTVRGEAQARLLPFPSVTFTDVAVAGGPDGAPAMTAERFSMDAELAPFMRGELLIFDMRLERPHALVEIGRDGRIDWAVRPNSPVGARQISLERLTVTDGVLTILHGPSDRQHVLSGVEATLTARTLAGPWRIDGRGEFDGSALSYQVSTGAVDDGGGLRIKASIVPDAYPLTIDTEGTAQATAGAFRYAGTFAFNADAAARPQLGVAQGAEAPQRRPSDYRVSGRFALGHERIAIDEFRLETGPAEDPYTADGKASIDLGTEPRFSIEANGAQVRFDRQQEDGAPSTVALVDRVAALRRFLVGLPRPTIPGSVNVNLPAVVVGDTTIRSVALAAEPVHDGWKVETLKAQLPGRTTLEASGRLVTRGRFAFDGPLLLAIAQPSGFASWIARDVDDAVRRLPAAGFSAKVSLGEKRQVLDDLELVLGDARFTGRTERQQPAEARPTLAIDLSGGALDVDALSVFASLFLTDTGVTRLADHDVDLALKAGPVNAAGLEVESLDTSLRLREGRMEVDRFSVGGLAGASVSATGTLRDFPAAPAGNIDLSVVSVDLQPLVELLAARVPGSPGLAAFAQNVATNPGLLADARLDLVASVAAAGQQSSSLAISGNGAAGGTRFTLTASGAVDRAARTIVADRPVAVSLSADSDDAAALYALVGLPALPLGLTGPATASLDASGTAEDGIATQASLTGEGLRLAFEGTASGLSPASLRGTVRLTAGDIEPWLVTGGFNLPGFGMGVPAELAADLEKTGEGAVLSGLSGNLLGDRFAGDVTLSTAGGRPHLTGALTLAGLDALDLAALVVGEDAMTGGGVFPTAATVPLTGDLKLEVDRLQVFDRTVENASFVAKIDADGIAVSDLKGSLHGGTVTGSGEFRNNAGSGLLSAQLALTGAEIARVPELAGLDGTGAISLSLTATGKSTDALVAALSGSGSARADGLVVPGFAGDALGPILRSADAVGRSIDAAAVARLVPPLVSAGSFGAEPIEAAFTVAGGQVRMPPVVLQGSGARLTSDIRIDLAAPLVRLDGEFALDAGPDALVGSEPTVRFGLAGLPGTYERTLDTGPMAQFLIQRALEKEQARVEAMQAVLLEQQRLRRETRYYLARAEARAAAAEITRQAEEAARLEREASDRARAEAEAKRATEAAEEKARAAAEAERVATEQAAEREAAAKAAADEAAAEARAAEDAARRAARQAERAAAEEAARAAREADRRSDADEQPAASSPDDAIRLSPLPAPTIEGDLPGVDPGAFPTLRGSGASVDDLLRSLDDGTQ